MIDESVLRGVVVLVLSEGPFVYDSRIIGIVEEGGRDEGLDNSMRNEVILRRR